MVSAFDMNSIQDYVENLDQAGVARLKAHCNSVLNEQFDICLTRFPTTREQDRFELAVEVMARLDMCQRGNHSGALAQLRERYLKVYDLNLDTLRFVSN
ncbi:MAG: hypothetical protein ACR2QG_12015 [Gammaproteobacteria bacterium]